MSSSLSLTLASCYVFRPKPSGGSGSGLYQKAKTIIRHDFQACLRFNQSEAHFQLMEVATNLGKRHAGLDRRR